MNTTTLLNWTAAPCLLLVALNPGPANVAAQQERAWSPIAPEDLADAAAWRELLAEPQLERREANFAALVDRAAAHAQDLMRLEAMAGDSAGGEFAWTCRLALRELRARQAASSSVAADPFEALRQQMFSDPLRADPFAGFRWIDPLSMQGNDLFRSPPGAGANPGSNFESFRMEMSPGNVRVQTSTRNEQGEVREQEYTAGSLEELLEQHPELSEHLGNGRLRVGTLQGVPGLQQNGLAKPVLRTDVLGVYVAQSAQQAADQAPAGLRIQQVAPGTLASELGLQSGQWLVQINGRAIESREDISAALRERKPDQALEVQVRGEDGRTELKTWTPGERARGQARPLEARPKGEVRKI